MVIGLRNNWTCEVDGIPKCAIADAFEAPMTASSLSESRSSDYQGRAVVPVGVGRNVL